MTKLVLKMAIPALLRTQARASVLVCTLHAVRADTMTTTTLSAPLQDIISPKFHQNNFVEEVYVKNDLGIKLDKGRDTNEPPSSHDTPLNILQTTRYVGCR